MKLLNRAGLIERGITYGLSQLNRKMREGTFPQPVKGIGGKENRWLEEEIEQYLAAQISARAPRPPLRAAGTGRGA